MLAILNFDMLAAYRLAHLLTLAATGREAHGTHSAPSAGSFGLGRKGRSHLGAGTLPQGDGYGLRIAGIVSVGWGRGLGSVIAARIGSALRGVTGLWRITLLRRISFPVGIASLRGIAGGRITLRSGISGGRRILARIARSALRGISFRGISLGGIAFLSGIIRLGGIGLLGIRLLVRVVARLVIFRRILLLFARIRDEIRILNN